MRSSWNFLSPEPNGVGFAYLQVAPACSGAGQLMTSNVVNCAFIPFPGLHIKRTILIHTFVSKKIQMGTIKVLNKRACLFINNIHFSGANSDITFCSLFWTLNLRNNSIHVFLPIDIIFRINSHFLCVFYFHNVCFDWFGCFILMVTRDLLF